MNNQNKTIDINSDSISTSSVDIEYPTNHYLKTIIIYFICMYFASSVAQTIIMALYKLIFDMPSGYQNANGELVYTQHFSDFVNLWTQISVYLAIFIVLVLLLRKAIQNDILRTKINLKSTFKKAGKGICFVYIASYICNLVLMLLRIVDESENQTQIVDMLHSSQTFAVILYCGILIIAAPIVEELIFRKSMFSYLKRYNLSKNLKILITGILFGGIHVATAILIMILDGSSFKLIITEFLLGIPYCVMGCVLGYIYADSDENFVVPTLVHMFNNAASVIINLLLIKFI